jgi:phosphinothricin acetyltransferase
MRVRAATTTDAERCASIYAPFVRDTCISFEITSPSVDEIASRIQSALTWLVAEDAQGKVAGYAYAGRHREREAYARSADVTAYIDPVYARQGFGRLLYGQLLPALKQQGFHAAFSGIALPNAASVGLHEAMGFSPVGVYREVGWKFGQWHDVGWWQRLL